MRHQKETIRKGEKPKKESLTVRRGISVLVGSALLFAVGLGAIGRNALLHESATTGASEKFERAGNDRKVSLVPAPSGVDAGNQFIAQASSSGASGASLAPVYDPLRRIVKIVETTGGTITSTKQFVWAGDQLCEERDAGGAVTRRFFSNGEQIGGTNYYYTRDHLGSVREMSDGSGSVVAAFAYDPVQRSCKALRLIPVLVTQACICMNGAGLI